jgi:acyl-coenzyme A thioesterase PaaI-like protein
VSKSETIKRMEDGGGTAIADEGFTGLAGPFFLKGRGADLRFGFPTEAKHHNRRGVLQGGALMTFADKALGMTARTSTQAESTATVQLDVHFIDAVHIGELIETRPRMVRAMRQLIFVSADLTVGARTVALANGLWKKLAAPGAAKSRAAAD